MEMEKISGSFPYVNRNPEFRWKPYLYPDSWIVAQFLKILTGTESGLINIYTLIPMDGQKTN